MYGFCFCPHIKELKILGILGCLSNPPPNQNPVVTSQKCYDTKRVQELSIHNWK